MNDSSLRVNPHHSILNDLKNHIKCGIRIYQRVVSTIGGIKKRIDPYYLLDTNLSRKKFFEFRAEQNSTFSRHYINLTMLLFDPKIADWKGIPDDDFNESVGTILEETYIEENWRHFNELIINRASDESLGADEREYWREIMGPQGCFSTILESQDAQGSGKQNVQRRMIAVLKVIIGEDTSDEDRLEFLKILYDHSTTCADQSAAGLEKLELFMAIKNSKKTKFISFLVNSWKRSLIDSTIAIRDQGAESLEMGIFHTTRLKDALGIRTNLKSIAFIDHVKKILSAQDALDSVYRAFTVDDLVGAIGENDLFQDKVKHEMKDQFSENPYVKKVFQCQAKYDAISFEELETSTGNLLLERLTRARTQFFEAKALDALIDSGFIRKDTNFESPDVFPIPELHSYYWRNKFKEACMKLKNLIFQPYAVAIIFGFLIIIYCMHSIDQKHAKLAASHAEHIACPNIDSEEFIATEIESVMK